VPRGAALLVHFYAANMTDTQVCDVKVLGKAANSAMLLDEVKKMMTAEGFLSEAEWSKHVKIFAGDHAAYVLKAARDGGLDFSGDPAHAFDLVIKVILAAANLKPLFMLLRKVLNSHSYVMVRACEAFMIPKGVAKAPITRWGNWALLLRFLSDAAFVCRLQQMLAWLFVHLYKGDEAELAAGVANAPWLLGVNFAPEGGGGDDDDDDDAEHGAVQNLADHAKVNWGAKGAGHEMESDDEDDAPSAAVDKRKQKAILQLLRLLCDPRILSQIRAVGLVSEPLRAAQVVMQTSDSTSPKTVASMQAAYDALTNCVKSAATFDAWIEAAFPPIVDSVGVEPAEFSVIADVEKMANGTLIVNNIADLKTPTLIRCCADLAAVSAMKDEVRQCTRPSILGAVGQYMKFCAAAFTVAERRSIAAGNKLPFKNVAFLAMMKAKPAPGFASPSPPDLRGGAGMQAPPADDADAAGGLAPLFAAEDASANAINAEFGRFLAVCDNVVSEFYFNPAVDIKKGACNYWLRVRKGFPNVAAVMLWWLSFPVGTAGLERDFSGLTMVTRDSRRHRLKVNNFRYAVLVHCFKGELAELLAAHVRGE
jgi:hypothetical protein